ncbi:Derlin 1 [Rhizophlyctis rosea]|uniref:Derlin n=1 Tax=Rhizophlyctis rosea TaxID=64517 RepID=A0AAD5WXP1_9FUNG|nr:Derlin 1 [Rhizophlyctis rosea]
MEGRHGPFEEVIAWFKRIPPVTRILFTGTLLASLAAHFGLIRPFQFFFAPVPLIVPKLQIWRLVTNFFIQPVKFDLLVNLFYLYSQSYALETSHFTNRTADYGWCVFLVMMILNGISTAFFFLLPGYFMPVMSQPLIIAIVYVWSQFFREVDVTFMFGLRFKALFLPWALVALDILSGGNGISSLTGILAGHIYYFLDHLFPLQNDGQRIVSTPQFLYNYFPPPAGSGGAQHGQAPGTAGVAGGQQPAGPAGLRNRHTWGSGQRLGDG